MIRVNGVPFLEWEAQIVGRRGPRVPDLAPWVSAGSKEGHVYTIADLVQEVQRAAPSHYVVTQERVMRAVWRMVHAGDFERVSRNGGRARLPARYLRKSRQVAA